MDDDFRIACSELSAVGRSKTELATMSSEKSAARSRLIDKWASDTLSPTDIQRCVDSISDHNSHIVSNRLPVDRMIGFLKQYFGNCDADSTLAIRAGVAGSKLSHDHATQFNVRC